jgi:hypothetical protein
MPFVAYDLKRKRSNILGGQLQLSAYNNNQAILQFQKGETTTLISTSFPRRLYDGYTLEHKPLNEATRRDTGYEDVDCERQGDCGIQWKNDSISCLYNTHLNDTTIWMTLGYIFIPVF